MIAVPQFGIFDICMLSRSVNIITSPLGLYECGTFTLREEHGLEGVCEQVQSGIFGPKREEVTGGWRKSHNGELNNI
jgi:hypothetical protein